MSERIEPGCKLWLSNEDGGGDREGSLSAACASLGISYRKAWGELRKAEKRTGQRLIWKHRGGRDGGHTELTPAGRKWLKAWEAFRREAKASVAQAFETHLAELCHEATGTTE